MHTIFQHQKPYPQPIKRLFELLCVCLSVFVLFTCVSCGKKIDYFSYVSELRDNVFLAENERFSLRAYALEKESPYVTDGIPCEKNVRTEIYLCAPSGDKTCNILFHLDGNEYGGEMSYDNVKGEYFYACPASSSALSAMDFEITYGKETFTLTANSVHTESTLSAKSALRIVVDSEMELFSSLTDKYGFAGEIYMRLLYEDAPFYYVGVINRNGEVTAFLLNATTGRILAKRNP